MSDVIDFEVFGATPEIELPVNIEFLDKRFKAMNFKAHWVRGDVDEARQTLSELLAKEEALTGAELADYQTSIMRERLIAVKNFPTSTGKRIHAGPELDYDLDSLLDKVLPVPSYHIGFYKSLLSSLTNRDLAEAKRKN